VRSATTLSEPRAAAAALLGQRRLRGRRFTEAYSDAVDAWVGALLPAARGRVALVAVGGYGRRELAPGSDLDLVLVHDGVRGIGDVAERLWYAVWDAGLQLDHSVRTAGECVRLAETDLRVALGLLTARCVAGDAALAGGLVASVRERWAARSDRSLGGLRDAMERRWAQHGELAFLLEPDVKLSRGGLRDVEALYAAALAAPVAAAILDDPGLEAAADELLSVRVALHAATGKRGDRLGLEEQDLVARRLGLADAEELLPQVAAAARRVQWTTDQVWRRIESWRSGPRRGSLARPLGPGVAVVDDELVLDATALPGEDPALPFRLAAAAARTGLPVAQAALVRLENESVSPPEPWPAATRDALVDLLGCGHAAVPLLETLDHIGVLGRYVREWAAVRSRPQRNTYHRFTVDRHLFEAAAEAAASVRAVARPDLLLLGAWLHDIGKGFPGDHTEVGARLVAGIGARLGLGAADVAVLVRLVENHLLLAEAATRRDLDDPATVDAVLARVPDVMELELLAALTRADSVATGPAAWSAWKAGLVDSLVARVAERLAGRTPEAVSLPTGAHRALMAGRALRVVPDEARVTVVAPDRPGLLAVVAGVLALHRLPVRAANGATEDGMAVQVFDVEPSVVPRWPDVEAALAVALDDPASVEVRLASRSRAERLPRRPGAATPPASRVLVDNDSTGRATIVEVRSPDSVGLLARLAGAIARADGDIGVVRVLTFGHEVVDTFYVTDRRTGAKVTDVDRLERAVLAALVG
jgi:[protein-PII] uridylyltransferase